MKLLNRIFIGLGVGPIVYLIMLYINSSSSVITRLDINCLIAISIFTSLTSVIFDKENLSYLSALVLHYISVNIIVTLVKLIYKDNTLRFTKLYFIYIFIAYFLSWLIIVIRGKFEARKLNRYLELLNK